MSLMGEYFIEIGRRSQTSGASVVDLFTLVALL